ncbi:MAG: hypothetical protein ACWGOD_07860 [Desulfobulbales bacterium]
MRNKATLNKNGNFLVTTLRTLFFIFIMAAFAGMTGCSRYSIDVDLPVDFIHDFIAKHETMVDKSLVYYYPKEEQSSIAERVNIACRICQNKGTLESLQQADFDFSELQLKLLDKKEDYFNDEPVIYLKVAVKGNYTMRLPEESMKINANDILVLRMAHDEWKVTETMNPWS